ncbi:accessory factor UbiK family protein [Ostreiculturibacter nitratireducens]|uniref:accessory factor UbiK family protein n=1 Tax=Ostreiculturibacter nitratireducens TaxID=3075226 RepID=UPI0031B627A5
MQGQNKFFDDISRLMTNAMGVAQGAKTEAETAMKGWVDRWMADRDFVTREEFDAVRAMAVKAREENAALAARVAALEAALAGGKPAAAEKKPASSRAKKTD